MARSAVIERADAERRPGPPSADLQWLRDVLWAPDAQVRFTTDRTPTPGERELAAFVVRPDAARPELLVPVSPARAAASVAHRYSDGLSRSRRTRNWLGEGLLRVGALQRAWPHRVLLVGSVRDHEDPDRSLVARLGLAVGEPDVRFGVTLGAAGSFNRKPVVQLLDPAGRTMAFAKVAVDDLTDEYVGNEASWLGRASNAPRPLCAPALIEALTWMGRAVTVSAPVPVPRRSPRGAADRTPTDVVAAVSSLGTVAERPVAELAAVAAARQVGLRDEADRVEAAHAAVSVASGAWHGDLSPWNMVTSGGLVHLWDWEFAADGHPLGADALHHRFQRLTHLAALEPASALERTWRFGRADLDRLGVASNRHRTVYDVWLLELARRARELERRGRHPVPNGIGEAALLALQRTIDG